MIYLVIQVEIEVKTREKNLNCKLPDDGYKIQSYKTSVNVKKAMRCDSATTIMLCGY
jgi:hypothetical protein